ncbi:MAG: hypothetical protein A2Z97_14320 [Bdellovibrionales bacterium GWB1_52_6]|nr:MAG: hypothetical protein A2Z97_14320 [Bdellovibrionales bacterium GWB1_52_6]
MAALVFGGSSISHGASELARVNNKVITLEDFNKKFGESVNFFQFKARGKKVFLEDLIKRELGIQEARRLNLDKDPEIMERVNSVLYQALIEKKLAKEFEAIQVSDPEAKSYYDKYPEIRSSHIFAAIPAGARPEDEKKALDKIKKIYDQYVKDGKTSFAEIAQRFSEGVAAPMGGDIDYQTKDKLDPVYYDTALKLKTPGKISNIVRSQFGYHIIKLTAVRSWEDVDKAQIKRLVFDEKRALIFEKFMNQLRQQAKVSVRSDLIKD